MTWLTKLKEIGEKANDYAWRYCGCSDDREVPRLPLAEIIAVIEAAVERQKVDAPPDIGWSGTCYRKLERALDALRAKVEEP